MKLLIGIALGVGVALVSVAVILVIRNNNLNNADAVFWNGYQNAVDKTAYIKNYNGFLSMGLTVNTSTSDAATPSAAALSCADIQNMIQAVDYAISYGYSHEAPQRAIVDLQARENTLHQQFLTQCHS